MLRPRFCVLTAAHERAAEQQGQFLAARAVRAVGLLPVAATTQQWFVVVAPVRVLLPGQLSPPCCTIAYQGQLRGSLVKPRQR